MKRLYNLTDRNMNRVLLGLVVILALAGGYYHAQLQTLKRRYGVLQTRYTYLQQQQTNAQQQERDTQE